MPRVPVQGLASTKQEELLAKGRYTVECTQSGIVERGDKNQSLRLNFVVKAGPTQPNGESPEDRRLSDFIPLSGHADMKDGGEFVKRKLKSACDALSVNVDEDDSFDYDDFVGARCDVLVRHRENPESGLVEAQINQYIPGVEG